MNYKVYQGTELKQTVTDKIAVMNGLQPNQTYDFSVEPDNVTNLLLGTAQPFSMTGNNTANQCAYANSLINGYNVSSLASKLGTQFTVSFDWSVSGSSPSGSFTAQWDAVPWDDGGIWNVTPVSSSNTSGHISNTIRVSTDSKNVATTLGFRLDNFVGTITFTNLKLVKGSVATTSVTTRGIRFNIPKTLTVGSTIALRYEEYPLGIVPIGNEPSGMFGGGNKQNLSAKVISTANGSSIVEVAGNVIDVGGRNLLQGTSGELSGKSYWFAGYQISGGLLPGTTYTLSGWARVDQTAINNKQYVFVCAYINDWSWSNILTISGSLTSQYNKITFTTPSGKEFNPNADVYLSHPDGGTNESGNDSISGMGYISKLKLEPGTIATPYASFVDGDTFIAQPDGTCALFSEYKALYY